MKSCMFVRNKHMFGLSFWRHPFTAEDLLVSKWCNDKFHQICSDEETNSSTLWMDWGWVHFQQNFIFAWTIALIYVFIVLVSIRGFSFNMFCLLCLFLMQEHPHLDSLELCSKWWVSTGPDKKYLGAQQKRKMHL